MAKRGNLLQFALIFAVIYLGSQFVMRQFFPEQFDGKPPVPGVHLTVVDATITEGHHPEIRMENKTAAPLTLPDRCPRPPVDVFFVENPGATPERFTPLESAELAAPCQSITAVAAGAAEQVSLGPWKYSIFARKGTYELRLPLEAPVEHGTAEGASQSSAVMQAGTGAGSSESQWAPGAAQPRSDILSARVVIREPGAFTKIFRTFITAPLLNFLLLIGSVVPFHDLGLSIILLTIAVKILLFWPTHKSMEGQKKMQLLQPKIEVIQKQHKGDAQKIQEETMKLWKEHKINPFSACLPTLIQFPILIGLFYVIKDSNIVELSRHLIYAPLQDATWTFHTQFLGLDLLKPSMLIMPPLLVIMQYLQMKLAFAISDRKKAKENVIDIPTGKEPKEPASAQQMQQKMMLYGLPIMIGVFAFQFPAAVSLYWGVSTLFGIGQQLIVNREHLRP